MENLQAVPNPETGLFLLAINLTERCNLGCAHCYMDAQTLAQGAADELATLEVCRLLDDIAARSVETMVVLTGGEPLLRGDLEELIAHGRSLGLSMVVGSNGLGLTERRAASLKTAGAMGVGISVDSLDPAKHDAFRGVSGAWAKTMNGIEACRRQGLPFQIHFSVTESNAAEVPAMIDFARALGARVLNVFFLVCTGRGQSMSDISPASYERVLDQLVAAQEKSQDLLIRARCAPHFKRLAYQRDPASPLTRAAGYEGGGCLAGSHYCRITPRGEVTACPYIAQAEGSIRERSFWEIWDHAPGFQRLRVPALKGPCGRCEFRELCGGCRARPLAQGGDLMDSDPWCVYVPQGGAVIAPLAAEPRHLAWTPEAKERLARVPSFLRKMVAARAEAYVAEIGQSEVTTEHLATLAARRFGAKGPPRPPGVTPPALAANLAGVGTALAWSEEADARLAALPGFLQEGVRAVAEDVARSEGRLEVNVKLLERLLAEDSAPAATLARSASAQALLDQYLDGVSGQARGFVRPALEAAAEQEALRRRGASVEAADAQAAIAQLSGGVEWEAEALERVLAAPDFIRAGIKKAAEFRARKEGLVRISGEDLTRFRNHAMMRAVQRMKGLGLSELSFDAYQLARERVPRLRDNPEADKRFAAIKSFVTARPAPGDLLGRELLEQMRARLRGDAPRPAGDGVPDKTADSDGRA